MRVIAQLIIDGLAMGLVYVIMASGVNLVLAVPGIMFIALGHFYMLAAYVVWFMVVEAHLNFYLAVMIATLGTGLVGAILYQIIFRHIQFNELKDLTNIFISVGLMLIITQVALFVFGTLARAVPAVIEGTVNAWGLNISVQRLVLVGIGAGIIVVLHIFLRYTKQGRAMRAVAFNTDVAGLQGVNADRTFMLALAVGCALSGFAGGIMSPVFGASTTMTTQGLLVLLVVMLGGIGSMFGALLGGIVFGMVLSFGQYYVGAGEAQIVFFGLIFLMLYFRPGGILGAKLRS